MAKGNCLIMTPQLRELAKKFPKETEESIKNLVGLWQVKNNKTIEDIPTGSELNKFIQEVRKNISDTNTESLSEVMSENTRKDYEEEFDKVFSIPKIEVDKRQKINLLFDARTRRDRVELISRLFSVVFTSMIEDYKESLKNAIDNTDDIEAKQQLEIKLQEANKASRQKMLEIITPYSVFKEVAKIFQDYINDTEEARIKAEYDSINSRKGAEKYTIEQKMEAAKKKAQYKNTEYHKIVDDLDVFKTLASEASRILAVTEKTQISPNFKTSSIQEFIEEDPEGNNTSSLLDATDKEESSAEGWIENNKRKSSYERLSQEVRKALREIPRYNNKGVIEKDDLGYPRMLDAEYTHAYLIDKLRHMTSPKEMIPLLEELSKVQPWIKQLIKVLKNDEILFSKFFSDMRKDFVNMWIQKRIPNPDGTYRVETIPINRPEGTYYLLESWRSNYEGGYILDDDSIYNEDGTLNKEHATNGYKLLIELTNSFNNKNTNERLAALDEEETFNKVMKLLHMVGINIDPATARLALFNITKIEGVEITDPVMLLFNSLNIILKKVSEGKEEALLKETKSELNIENEDNKIIDLINTFGSAYNSIADLFNTVVNDAIESSTREGDKSYYSHTTPNYLGKLISRLKNVLNNEEEYEKFIQKEFKTFEWFNKDGEWRNDWLEQLAISKEMRKALDHKILLNVDKVESDGWDTLDHTIILLTEYWGDPDSKGSIKYGWFPVPTLSDSGSAEFIRFRRYTNGDIEDDFGNPLKATDIIIDKLVNLVNQEYDRIRLVVERDKELQRSGTRLKAITNYDVVRENGKVVDKGGAEFKFLPALNTYRDKEGNLFIQGLKNRVNSSSSGEEIREYIKEALRDVMENDFEAFFEKMFNIGLLEETPEGKYKHLNFKFKTTQSNYNNTIKNSLNKAKEILGKSFNSRMEKLLNSYANNKPIDDRFATVVFEEIKGLLLDKALQGEITEQTVKDISRNLRVHNTTKDGLREYFYNHVLATSQIIQLVTTDLAYYKNMEDFYKRIKQIHSPSIRLNTQATYKGKKIGREIERTILIKDEKIKSSMYEDVKELVEEKFKKGELSEIDKDFILSQYSKVNVTDAQAFRSLSSYRAVLGMMGEWTDGMQNTLERFEKGEWDIEDFLVIWQTKKPFMYTQVGKDSGVEGFGKIRQAIQHKNSEFLLLAMYNLMTSSKGGQNRLRAINKFMEGNNIDVVQFDSTTKVGQQGAIDLSDVETEADIIAKLEKETCIKDGNINPDVVHEIPYEDYGIQQATPEHHIDRAMALGTQIRKLIIADISDTAEFVVNGKKYDKNSLIRMYQELITEGIIRGFQEVDEIFADPKKVEEILLNEVSNNPRYSSELVEACTLNEEGMFNIPLFDEVQSKRVQQLLLSVIRDRITKQKIKGGSFIQVSAFGYTDKLHIEWEGTGENKRIKYAQCYMPAYSRKFLEAYIDEKTGIIDISKVPEDLLKAVGYRVPTEDKYSMLPLKIVGFLPWQNGSAIMLPAEITAIAGSDYDVDKMYVVLPEFKTYEYDMARARKDFAKISSIFESILNDSNIKTNDLIEEVLDIDNNDFKEWFDSVKEEYKYDKPRLAKVKYNNSKPIKSQSKAAINNQVLDTMFSILTNSDTAIKIANPGGPKNIKRVSYILNVLKNTDEDTLFNRLQEIDKSKYSNKKELVSYLFNMPSDILEKLVNKNQNNPLSPISQLSAHDRIMAGANLIGGYANHNAAHAVAQFSELELTDSASFVLNGKVLKSLHNIKNMEKGFISRNTSEFLGAAVDNAKDPILGEFNQNFFTLDATMLLSRLGYTHLEIGLLLNQPIVRDITTNYLRGRKEYKKAEDAINEVITDYSKKALDVRRVAPRDKNNSFLIEDLAKYIMIEKIATTDVNSTSNLDAIEFYQRQVEIGYLFQKIYTAADALGSLTSAIKADTTKGAAGPSIAETINKIQKLEKIFETASANLKYPLKGIDIIVPYDDSLLSLPLDEIREGIMKTRNPFLQAFYTLGLTSVSRFFSRYFPHFNHSFISVLNTLKDMTKTGSLNTKTINSIFSDLIAYIMSDVEFFGNSQEEGLTITQKRDYFINKFPEYFDKIVSENPDIAELEFIKRLKTVNKNKKNPVKTIVFKNVGRLSSTLRDRFTQEWESLLYSSNPKAQELALNLFRYNYYRNGFAFGPSTFIHLTPNAIRKIIPGYIEALNKILKDKNADYKNFVLQYIYNHLDNKQLVPSIPNNSSVVFEDDNKDVVKSFVFVPTESNKTEKFIKQVIYIDGEPGYVLMDFVSKTIRGKEYYYRHMGNGLYQMIQPLGVKNNFIEYEFGKDVEEIISVVGENSQFYDPYSNTSTKFNSNNFTYDDATPEMSNDMELGSSYFDSLNDVGKSYFGEGFDVKVKDNDISSIKSNNDYKDSTGKKPC